MASIAVQAQSWATKRMESTVMNLKKSEWFALTGLLVLSFVPSVGGALRLLDLNTSMSMAFLPENLRVLSAPLPVEFHIFSSVPYCILGIFQFLPTIRRRHPLWHRCAGKLLVVAGLVSALSGLWMTHMYAFPEGLQGDLLFVVRNIVSLAMVLFILLGLSSVLSKKIALHQAWMIRAYALGQGAGTQGFVMLPWIIAVGEPSGLARDVLMTTGWAINIIVAEWVIQAGRESREVYSSTTSPSRFA